MSELSEGSYDDPWAWLHDIDETEPPDYSAFHIVAAVLPDAEGSHRCEEALEQSAPVAPAEIRHELPPTAEGDWFWILPADSEPAPESLTALLDRVRADRDVAVVGSLVLAPRRRGAGKMVADWAQTIGSGGRARPLTEPGELYQGQLTATPALGVPLAGMLVRGDAWRFLGGLNTELPESHQGLDFGWRANLSGLRVVAEPDSQLYYAEAQDPVAGLAAGMALVSGHSKASTRWLTSLRIALVALLTAAGYLLGKDLERAREELAALGRWLGGRKLRRSVKESLGTLPIKASARQQVAQMRSGARASLRRRVEQIAGRLVEWGQTFTGRGTAVSIDEMTGDDFAEVGTTRYRLPLAVTGLIVLFAAALFANRTVFGEGSLTGAQLLAAPQTWGELMAGYLAPVPGTAHVSGAPWVGLTGILSLLTLGQPEWLVTATFVAVVPLAWLLAFRLLRQLVADRRLAALGALGYALGAVMIGGLDAGSFSLAASTILLPVLGYSLWHWLSGSQWSWRRSGTVAFWMLLACSLVPLFWVVGVLAAVLTSLRAGRPRAWLQWTLVLGAPLLLLVGPWGATLLAWPGRLLTGAEPQLAPTAPAPAWSVLLGQALEGAAPLWLAAAFFGVLWLAAAAGSFRRPQVAGWAFAGAGAAAVVSIILTRLVVQLPPGAWARPLALEWQLLVVAALVLATSAGLDGAVTELQGRDLGVRHLAGLGLTGLLVVALGLGSVWWLWAGQTGLERRTVGAVPAFVRNAQVSATPGRTLIIDASAEPITWALLEGDFARLGDAERGTAFGGNAAAKTLAASVAARLVGDSGDDQILGDLVSLGVSNLVLTGGSAELRQSVNNVPGLGLGTGEVSQIVWPVPNSAIVVVEEQGVRQVSGVGSEVNAGGEARVLRLAEPGDPRWRVKVGGASLSAVAGGEVGTGFDLGVRSGALDYELDAGSQWWAWVQLGGLILLAILAAPSVRRRDEMLTPRRIAGGAE